MSRKATLELSINAIVIIVIAITVLGFSLVFVRNIFSSSSEVVNTLLSKEPEAATPTTDYPITSSREEINAKPGETIVIRFKILYPTDADWTFKEYTELSPSMCGKGKDNVCYVDSSMEQCNTLNQAIASGDSDCKQGIAFDTTLCTGNTDGICYVRDNANNDIDTDCDPTCGVTLSITGCTFDVHSEMNQIKIGEIVPYTGVMIIPKTQPKGTLVCRVSINSEGASIGKDIVFNVE